MRKLSQKQAKAIRFVLGPILIVTGLFLWNYMIGDDMNRMLAEAFQAGQPPQIDFTFMLKGVAPLAVALIGLKLVTWKTLTATDE
jgi:hypothetical protein